MHVTKLGEDLTILDTPRCYREGSPEEREEFRAWVEDNFPDDGIILAGDIYFTDPGKAALFMIRWRGL